MHLHNWWQWLQQYCRDLYNSLCLILTSVWEYRSPQLTVSFWPWVPSSLTSSHPDERVRVPITTTHFTSSWPWASSLPQFTVSSWPWVHPHHNSLCLILTMSFILSTIHFVSSWRAWGYRSPQLTVSLWPWDSSSLTSSHPGAALLWGCLQAKLQIQGARCPSSWHTWVHACLCVSMSLFACERTSVNKCVWGCVIACRNLYCAYEWQGGGGGGVQVYLLVWTFPRS